MSFSRKTTVLVVEDHLVTLDGLAASLSSEPDIEVVGRAADTKTGLRLAKELQPDVVLLDLHLPDSTGPKSLLRTFREATNAKIVIFSGENRQVFVEAVVASGADAFIHKSKPAAVVANRLRELMGGILPTTKRTATAEPFSDAEQDILRMLARGMKYQDIATKRSTATETVRKQCDRLQLKLELNSREELIAWAVANGYGAIDD
jgi:two-component system nitrate/nitrite response regulator NarL